MDWTVRELESRDELEFCHCLESWSDEMAESKGMKARWLSTMKTRGLGVRLAVTGDGHYAGMIQYYPAAWSPAAAEDEGIWFIHCIWVHGHRQGQGNFQGMGIGTALLKAAEQDIRARGGKAVLAWGLTLPFWMKSRWYRKHGYVRADRDGARELVIKSLDGLDHRARWRKQKKTPPRRREDGTAAVTMFMQGACPIAAIAWNRLQKAANEQPVHPVLVDTSVARNLEEWGITDALYIGRHSIPVGPPPSENTIRKALRKEVRSARIASAGGRV